MKLLAFLPVGILAGILGSVVGIASLASYPALIMFGLPPITANVTNLTSQALLCIGSVYSSFKDIKHHYKQTAIYTCLLFLGAAIGTVIVLHESSSTFAKIVPFFVLAATVLILKPQTSHKNRTATRKSWLKYFTMVVLFLLGIYCAYFGAGSGIVYLALMGVVSTAPFKVYNSVRNVTMVGPAVVSAVVYATQAPVNWAVVVPLGIGMLLGGYLGPIIVRHVDEKKIKLFVVFCGIILTIYLFMKAYA